MKREVTNVSCVTVRRPKCFMGRCGADAGMKEGGRPRPSPVGDGEARASAVVREAESPHDPCTTENQQESGAKCASTSASGGCVR